MSKNYRRNLIEYWQQLQPEWQIPVGYHVHHIKPICTFDNKDDPRIHHPSNLVALHPDDHISIHKCRGDKWINGGALLSVSGRVVTNTTKKKMSLAKKGSSLPQTHKTNISKGLTGHVHSTETKQKIGIAHKGKIISDEQKAYLSELNTGNVVSEETKQKISETQKEQYANGRQCVKGMLGKTMSDEAKAKISQGNKGKKRTMAQRDAASKINKGRTWKVIDGKREWMDVN